MIGVARASTGGRTGGSGPLLFLFTHVYRGADMFFLGPFSDFHCRAQATLCSHRSHTFWIRRALKVPRENGYIIEATLRGGAAQEQNPVKGEMR